MTVGQAIGTKRFQPKRNAILAAAADPINEQSAKGMTRADLDCRVGLRKDRSAPLIRWSLRRR